MTCLKQMVAYVFNNWCYMLKFKIKHKIINICLKRSLMESNTMLTAECQSEG